MADILINEISQNYSYVIGDNSYCCVALPITASWGPAYAGSKLKVNDNGKIEPVTPDDADSDNYAEQAIEDVVWTRFKANSQGLESFVSTYRGAAANYRLANDYSYQMAVSLLTAGYDVLVCRVSPGISASGKMSNIITKTITATTPTSSDYVELDPESTTLSIPLNRVPANVNSFICTSTNPNFNAKYNRISLGKTGEQTADSKAWIEYDSANNAVVLKRPAGSEDYPSWDSVGIMADDSITVTYSTDIRAVNPETGEAEETGSLTLTAKYPGTFGNNIRCALRKIENMGLRYWNLITYIQDASGVRLAVENMIFTFDITNSTDNIPYVEEVQSQFVDIVAEGLSEDTIFAARNGQTDVDNANTWIEFAGGADKAAETNISKCLIDAIAYVGSRYGENPKKKAYPCVAQIKVSAPILTEKQNVLNIEDYDIPYNGNVTIRVADDAPIHGGSPDTAPALVKSTDYTISDDQKTITFTADGAAKFTGTDEFTYEVDCNCDCLPVYELLTDKLAYNPNRLISPGWDDQDFLFVTGEDKYPNNMMTPSPLQTKLMDVAYGSRCATAYLDIPRSLSKVYVTNSSQQPTETGYAQRLARYDSGTDGLRSTHAALFGPWGNYIYVGTNKQNIASPSFLALLIQRSMVLNQSLQYEWIQPTSRKNNVKIGKMDYTVSKKYLDKWQPDPDTEGGVGVNAIANIPDLGLSVWGDSTLYENPPATYQALRNLSTRLLVNAIKNVVYRVGISITFQYTNQTAFSSFYVGVTPILDSMKNAGAIGDYKVVIGNDFDAIGMVKANSCVGKIYITPAGTIQRITIDLIALPPQTDLTNYT